MLQIGGCGSQMLQIAVEMEGWKDGDGHGMKWDMEACICYILYLYSQYGLINPDFLTLTT